MFAKTYYVLLDQSRKWDEKLYHMLHWELVIMLFGQNLKGMVRNQHLKSGMIGTFKKEIIFNIFKYKFVFIL